jgi:hypothetical protein
MGRPGLVGTMARTAVVAGTATAVSGKVAQSQHDKAVAAQQQAAVQQPAAAPPPPAPVAAAPAGAPDLMDQLTKLGEMKGAGLLSDEEFAAAKARLLA